MKRALLIATGTVGGLSAVLAVTPPQFMSTQSSPIALPAIGATPVAPVSTPVATQSVRPTATAAATKSAKAKASAKSAKAKASAKSAKAKASAKSAPATKSADATGTTQSQTPAAQTPAAQTPASTPAPVTKSVFGTFTGNVVNVRYGNVQVKITVENGKITDAQAVQAPTGRNDRWTQMAVPILRQQTLHAQSAQINGASGASFTSYGWYTSLVSALAKAGM
jgi:uncharacterized protein with FMN-binding domain